MFWIWLYFRNSSKWSTGWLDQYFDFLCGHCGKTTAAMVRVCGNGSGSSQVNAQLSAQRAYEANGRRVVSAAGCPCCGQLQPATLEQFHRAAQKSTRHAKWRLPVAGLAALVTIALLAIPASSDLRYSAALAIVALAGAASVGLLLSTLLSVRITTPSAMPWGVWFSHDPSQGPASWFAAQPGPAPTVPQATPRARVLSLVGTLVAGTVAIGALIAWSQTYAKVYVVNAEGARGALVVRIDGAEVGRVKTKPALADVVYQQFEVRTNASHRIVVTDAAGLDRTFEVDPKKTRSGWVVAPYAYERGVCIATQTSYYGKEPSDNDDAVLNATSDLIALPRSFDYVFTAPPSVLQTTHASSQTRTALRALNCNEVERRPYPPRGNKRRNPDLL